MKRRFPMTAAAAAIFVGAMVLLPATTAAEVPPIGGGYTNVIPIPIDEPTTKAIAGALFKPEGAGPFPAVVYLGDCGPIGGTDDRSLEKTVVERNLSKGFATLILDSFTSRHQRHGVCDRQNNPVWLGIRAADAHAAKDALAGMPDVDAKRIFLLGYDHGGSAAILAADAVTAASHKAKFAGVVAYYPFCGFSCGCAFSVPTLIMIGDADELAPADRWGSMKNKANTELVIFKGATHRFATPSADGGEGGHRVAYDAKTAEDARARADAFIAAHMK
jgi:dienelactone hydrolase